MYFMTVTADCYWKYVIVSFIENLVLQVTIKSEIENGEGRDGDENAIEFSFTKIFDDFFEWEVLALKLKA